MSELEYDKNYSTWLTAAGITPASNPINLKGTVHQILQNLGGTAGPFVPESAVGAVNGVASLNSSGLVPVAQLPATAASSIRATTGAPVVLTADQVGDFAMDGLAGVIYGPLTGAPVVGQNWINGGTSGAAVNPISPNLYQTYDLPSPWLAANMPTSIAVLGSTAVTLVTGDLQMAAIYLPEGLTVSHLIVCTAGTGAGSPTHYWAGLYDNNRVQLATTNDTTTTAITTFTTYTFNIATIASGASTTFTTTYSGLHYVGINCTGGAPILYGAFSGPMTNIAPAVGGVSDTANTGPKAFPHTAGAITFIGGTRFFCAVS